jgi:methionine synthase II (cobalamin-independent)
MNIRGAVSGTHPLSEELIHRLLDWKYGRNTKKPVEERLSQELNTFIDLQENIGFPIISTGSMGLEDLIRPFTRGLKCLKSYQNIGDIPIVRWHYTNTFYRKPTLVERFPEDSNVILKDQHSLLNASSYFHEYVKEKESRIILPGPFTFVSLIEVKLDEKDTKVLYPSFEELIEDAGRFLAQEIAKLPRNYREIQFDEPILVWQKIPRNLHDSIIKAYDHIKSRIKNTKTIVNTYFSDVVPVLKLLKKIPVNGFGIDFISTNPIHLTNESFDGKIIQAGLINSKNFVPSSDGILDQSRKRFYSHIIEALMELEPKELIVSSNTGLEYFPKVIADETLKYIANIIREVNQ